jgi:hypothetical protein
MSDATVFVVDDDASVRDSLSLLISLARRLRELGVRSPLGFFLHIPFPHIQTLRVLPTYVELVRDLTAYDVVGFQTEGDLAAFFSCVEHVFGKRRIVDDRHARIGPRTLHCDVFPIGVDVDGVQDEAAEAVHKDASRRMLESLLGRKLVIGVDRLDYSKGLVERFASYEGFLETLPENHGQVTYFQIAPLSRKDVASYAEIRRALEQAAGRTNGRFADADWTPIRYLNRNFPHDTLMGLALWLSMWRIAGRRWMVLSGVLGITLVAATVLFAFPILERGLRDGGAGLTDRQIALDARAWQLWCKVRLVLLMAAWAASLVALVPASSRQGDQWRTTRARF